MLVKKQHYLVTNKKKQRHMDRKENIYRLSIELLQGQLNILIQSYGQEVDYFEFLKIFDFATLVIVGWLGVQLHSC